MKHFISKDKYFSFKEYPNKGNIINSITGTYASGGQITETLIGQTGMILLPKTENSLSSKKQSRYNFPETVTVSIDQIVTEEDKAKYNGGFRYEILVLRARNKRNANDFSSDTLEYRYEDNKYSTNISDVTENSYYKLTSGYLPMTSSGVATSITLTNVVNAVREVGFWNSMFSTIDINFNEAVTYYEPTIFGTPYYVQSFLYGYIVKVYGKTVPLEFKNKFSFSDVANGAVFNVDIPQNELLSDSSKYKDVDLANNIANRIFENYKNGRPTAELEWIGDPNVKVGDTVVIDNGIDYFVHGKKVSFNGGYGEKLSLIKKSNSFQEKNYIKDDLLFRLDGINHGENVYTWKDLSGNGNDFNIDFATEDYSFQNNAFYCDKYTYPIGPVVPDMQRFTLDCTFSVKNFYNIDQYICSNMNNGGYSLYIDANHRLCFAIQYMYGGVIQTLSKDFMTLEADKTYHISVVFHYEFGNSHFDMYSDGKLIGSKVFYNGYKVSPNNFAIGGRPTGDTVIQEDSRLGKEFNGFVNSVRLYSKENSDLEIYNNYEVDKERFG